MGEQKKEFVSGMDAKGIDRKVSEEVFSQIEKFARYGFNKAHSTCYALIAYQTAWLKVHYPRQFMAASLTSEIHNSDRINSLIVECRRMGIDVLLPDVNESKVDFTVVGENIRFGLQAVKNVGEAPARAIASVMTEGSRFKTLAELTSSIESRLLNRRTLESLIAAGACDSLEGNRAQKYEVVERMLEFGGKVFQSQSSNDLFASDGVIERVPPALKETPEWATIELLNREKEVLGFYISGHPLDRYKDELGAFATCSASGLSSQVDGREATVGGVISAVRTLTDKKGNLMAFATLEDFSGKLELILFSDCYEKGRENVAVDKMVLVTGRVSTREGEAAKLICSEILPLEKLTERFRCQLVIKLSAECSDKTIQAALAALEEFKGDIPVLVATRENGSEVYIRSRRYAVNLDFELLDRLKQLLGDSSAYLRPLSVKENDL